MNTQCMGCMDMHDYALDVCPHCGFKESEHKKIGYHLQPHTTLSDTYIVGKAIGYGGFGVTYVGYNAILEKRVAIKEYLPGEFATRNPGETTVTAFTGEKEQAYYKGLEQSEQEARRLAKLKNKEGIVDIYDCFRENNTVYIVMEYLQGETLKELLNREKRLDVARATDIIASVLRALKVVHQEGMIHRDISPENIFITEEDKITLIDFGAARNATTGHSKSLSVIVKQGYAPPEQYFSKGKQGPWTDVYATAATYYRMVTGITPDDAMERSGDDTLLPPSRLKVRLKKSQENALLNALILDVEKRTSTVDELLKGICGENSGVKKTKIRKKKADLGKLSLKAKLGIGLGFVVVIVGFVIGYYVVRDNLISDRETLQENQTYVPNVLNMSYEEAEIVLREAGLEPKIKGWHNVENMPANIVLEQEIAAGQVENKGTEIGLTLSNNGGLDIYVDDYVGMSKEEVIAKLDELQLYGEFEYIESAMTKGHIVSQEISSNEAVKKGNVIKFQVSMGLSIDDDTQVKVPNLAGMDLKNCMEKLGESKLHVSVSEVKYNKDIPKGQIISQNIKADSFVDAGTVIEVEISGGAQMVRIPNLDFYDVKETKKELESLGLNVVVDYDGVKRDEEKLTSNGVVLADVSSGDLVEVGSTVTLYSERGMVITTSIAEPESIYGNSYNVGDEVRVTLQFDYEEFGISSGWDMELGIDYDDDVLEFQEVEGNARAEFDANHSSCGQWCLYAGDARKVSYYSEDEHFLTLYYSFEGEFVSEKVTLVFKAKKEGSTNLNTFIVISDKSDNEVWYHMWPKSDIPYSFYHTSNHNNYVKIDVE